MPDPEEKDTKTSVPDTSEADARTVQDEILGKTPSEPAKKVEGEPEGKVEEKGEPAVKEKVEAKPKEEAKTPEAEEEAKIAEILSRFKGDPEAVKRQLAKAYREQEKMHTEQGAEVGELRKEALRWKQFQEDLDRDPEGTAKWLLERAKKQKEESSESVLDKVLDGSTTLDEVIDSKIDEREGQKNWVEQQETLMETRHTGWKDRIAQRNALREAVQLGKFPYPEEILDLAVRGAGDPEKLLADAKTAVEKERNDALAAKMEGQVQTQAGAVTEEKTPSDSRTMGDSVLTEEEKAHR